MQPDLTAQIVGPALPQKLEQQAIVQQPTQHSIIDHTPGLEAWGALLGAIIVSVIAIGKVIHYVWKSNRQGEPQEQSQNTNQRFINDQYKTLIQNLQDQIDNLGRELRELEYLREENVRLKIDVEKLKQQNLSQSEEILELRAKIRALENKEPY